ncbi:MAG: TIGR04219 family outer membrane beta-barrel protein [Campylobacterota bacterium]|nr:TIGR04219 family outer membrane beta-barrel protein [Campylobacterota bacterium]
MKKIALSLIATTAILSSSANAGMVIDVQAGAGIWAPELSGFMSYGTDIVNKKYDFDGLNVESTDTEFNNNYIYIDVDHLLPIVPNVRVERLNYSTSGDTVVTDTLTINAGDKFGDLVFQDGDSVKTELDMVQTDFILYWGIPGLNLLTAGIVDVDFGLMAKQLNGTYTMSTSSDDDEKAFDVWIPMAYAAVQVDVPFLPLELEASTKIISFQESEISDNMLKASLALPIPIPLIDTKLDVGYREQTLKIDPELIGNFEADIKAKGLFFGLSAKF